MAKKSKISKTKAVRDYLVKHPGAMPVDIAAALSKQGVTITAAYAATIKSSIKMEAKKPDKKVAAKETATKPAAVEVIVPVIIEKPASGMITLEQVKMVALTIKMVGGYDRLTELLDVIKELGSLKKFKDLAEAISEMETIGIPF
jgi:hypothetical protein